MAVTYSPAREEGGAWYVDIVDAKDGTVLWTARGTNALEAYEKADREARDVGWAFSDAAENLHPAPGPYRVAQRGTVRDYYGQVLPVVHVVAADGTGVALFLQGDSAAARCVADANVRHFLAHAPAEVAAENPFRARVTVRGDGAHGLAVAEVAGRLRFDVVDHEEPRWYMASCGLNAGGVEKLHAMLGTWLAQQKRAMVVAE